MESHLLSKDRRLNQYIHFEMLLYIHTQTTTHIYRTSKTTSPTQQCLQPGTSASPTPHQGSAGRCLKCSHHRISLHGLLTRERQNVKMLAKEQLVNDSCLFFLFKKPLNVEVLSSPRRKSGEHHRFPGFQGRGRHASLSKGPWAQTAAGWLSGLSSRLFQQVGFPTGALVPNHGLLKKSVNLG